MLPWEWFVLFTSAWRTPRSSREPVSMCETRQHNGDLSVCLSICQVSVFTGLIQECGDNKNTLKGGYHILFISGCVVLCRAALKLLIMPAKILHPDLLFLCESPICDFLVVHTTENINTECLSVTRPLPLFLFSALLLFQSYRSYHSQTLISFPATWPAGVHKKKKRETSK